MELYRKVLLACRDEMSERAAARHFGISRESVRKMLEFSVPPGYQRTAPVRRPKLDGLTGLIDERLRGNRNDDNRKQRHARRCHLFFPVSPPEVVAEIPAQDYVPKCVPKATAGLIQAFSTAPRASVAPRAARFCKDPARDKRGDPVRGHPPGR